MKNVLSKSIFVIVCLCLVVSVAFSCFIFQKFVDYRTGQPPTTYADKNECSNDGLIFHWTFDALEDGVAVDQSRNAIHGKVQNFFNTKYLSDLLYGKPKIVEGRHGQSAQFDGRQWVSAGNKSCHTIEQFTIALWVWQDNDDIFMPTIMAKSSWYGSMEGYDGWWLCTTPKKRFLDMGIAWGNGKMHVESGYHLPLNEWHHIAVSMDNVNREVQFYVDGEPFGEKHTNVHKWLINWNHDLMVAGYDGSGRWSWPGKLDDVRFYGKVLSADEIRSIYNKYSDG
jgi:hypothetical protein